MEPHVRSMILPIGMFASRRIFAGPYAEKPPYMEGVKLAPEVNLYAKYNVPIRDFGVPNDVSKLNEVIIDVLKELVVDEDPFYVGCYGGMGRTGMFLSLLAKTMGVHDPVTYVRDNYWEKAVERPAQHEFIAKYQPPITYWGRQWMGLQAVLHGPHSRFLALDSP